MKAKGDGSGLSLGGLKFGGGGGKKDKKTAAAATPEQVRSVLLYVSVCALVCACVVKYCSAEIPYEVHCERDRQTNTGIERETQPGTARHSHTERERGGGGGGSAIRLIKSI